MNAADIPYGQPCPICGPKGHAKHEDDGYGGCVTCREYQPHTDDEYTVAPFPCPATALAALVAAWDSEPYPPRERFADALAAARRALDEVEG